MKKNTSSHITINEFEKILKTADKSAFITYFEKSTELTKRNFGKNIVIYNPVYISSCCINNCEYCSYKNMENDGKILSTEEIKSEYNWLCKMGLKNVLIVSGQTGKETDLINQSIKIGRDFFDSISIEVGTYTKPELEEFVKNGADGFVLYQETYHRDSYKKYHKSGIKSDYNLRIKSHDMAAQSGFLRLGAGVLLGLYDYIYEACELFFHIDYLYSKYPGVEITLSLPRIVKAETSFTSTYSVSDFEYLRIITAFRIAFPHMPIYLSTREKPELRNILIQCGITHMSAGAKTSPGAYSIQNGNTQTQFEVSDKRDMEIIIEEIKKQGYNPVFKNWDKGFL